MTVLLHEAFARHFPFSRGAEACPFNKEREKERARGNLRPVCLSVPRRQSQTSNGFEPSLDLDLGLAEPSQHQAPTGGP